MLVPFSFQLVDPIRGAYLPVAKSHVRFSWAQLGLGLVYKAGFGPKSLRFKNRFTIEVAWSLEISLGSTGPTTPVRMKMDDSEPLLAHIGYKIAMLNCEKKK